MYAIIRRYRVDPDLTDDVISKIVADLSPIIREVQGYLAYNILDAGDGRIFTISVFENQAEAEVSCEIVAQWLRENVASFLRSGADLRHLRIEETVQGPFYAEAPRLIYERDPRSSVNAQALSRDEDPKPSGIAYPQLLSVEELCELLGVGKSWIYQRLKRGEIKSIRLGHSFRVRRDDLEEYLHTARYHPSEALEENTNPE